MNLFDEILRGLKKAAENNKLSDTALYKFFDDVFPLGPRVIRVGWKWLLEKGPTKTAVELIMQYGSPDLKHELLERLSGEAGNIAYGKPATRTSRKKSY